MRETVTRSASIHDTDRQPIGHIAVCLDRSSAADRAMPHAAAVAKAFGARLTALHVLEPFHHGVRATLTDPLDWEVQRTEAQRHLDGLQLQYADFGTDTATIEHGFIETAVLEGRPAEAIRDWVGSHGVDLTALTTHGERGRTEWSLASTARKLIDGVPGSMLLVPARPVRHGGGGLVRYQRVLVPLDGSPRAECALSVAVQLARSAGSELLLLHVVPRPPQPCPGPLDDRERDLDRAIVDRNVGVATAYLSGIARRVEGDGVRARTLVGVDSIVWDEIQHRIVADDVDLVVLSGHGHGGRPQHPVGSVATFLVEHATVPLLIVRHSYPGLPATGPDTPGHGGVRLPHLTDE